MKNTQRPEPPDAHSRRLGEAVDAEHEQDRATVPNRLLARGRRLPPATDHAGGTCTAGTPASRAGVRVSGDAALRRGRRLRVGRLGRQREDPRQPSSRPAASCPPSPRPAVGTRGRRVVPERRRWSAVRCRQTSASAHPCVGGRTGHRSSRTGVVRRVPMSVVAGRSTPFTVSMTQGWLGLTRLG